MRIDPSALAVVAICEATGCKWRTIRPTSAQAWTALAQHAKAVHADTRAVARARDAAYRARRRAESR